MRTASSATSKLSFELFVFFHELEVHGFALEEPLLGNLKLEQLILLGEPVEVVVGSCGGEGVVAAPVEEVRLRSDRDLLGIVRALTVERPCLGLVGLGLLHVDPGHLVIILD